MQDKYFYNLSVTIVGIIVSIFIFTTVGGLFHIPVNPFFVLVPFIGGIYYLRKQSPENIDFLKQFLILLLIMMVSYIISAYVWDSSSDGRGYHTAALVMYKNGWLPIYQKFRDFAEICNIHPTSAFWVNCYANFVEIIGANIYKLTNLLESAKAVNFIMLSAVFMYSFAVLKEFTKNKFIPLISSLIIILNPVCICQWFTNYIDLHIYFAFTLLVLTIIRIEYVQKADKTDLFMFVSSGLMLAMTKFTGSMYLFVICLIYLIYLFLLKRNIKKYVKTVLIIGGLTAITGVNPFYTNLRDYGNPFHPIFGEKKIDIIKENFPANFENKSALERFLRSNFSESVQSMNKPEHKLYMDSVELKIPFTLRIKSPYTNTFSFPDIRVGGFGYFWSGILLLSLFYLPFIRFRNRNERNIFWLITAMVLASTFSNPHCWWARFAPQFWLFSVFILLFGLLQEDYKNKSSKILKLSFLYFISVSFIVNSLVVLYQNTLFNLSLSKLLKAPYRYIDSNKTSTDKILLMVKPEGEFAISIDETIIPHLEEYYGKKDIIYVPYDENKIKSEKFLPIQYIYILNTPCYFFKIDKNP